jgi:hypothetical protein
LYAHIFLSYYLFLISNIPVKSSIFIEKVVVVKNSKIVRHNMKTCKNSLNYKFYRYGSICSPFLLATICNLQSSSLVIAGATSTSHRVAQTIIYLELKAPEQLTECWNQLLQRQICSFCNWGRTKTITNDS